MIVTTLEPAQNTIRTIHTVTVLCDYRHISLSEEVVHALKCPQNKICKLVLEYVDFSLIL